jgi:hypothetical protein
VVVAILETTTSYLTPPIKQNEEILQLFPHFSLFSILNLSDSLHDSIGAIGFHAAKLPPTFQLFSQKKLSI